LTTILAAAWLATGAAADDATARKELQAAYDRIVAAYKARDVKGIMAVCTGDYTGRLVNGKTVTRDQQEAIWKQHIDRWTSLREFSATIGKAAIRSDRATVTADWRITAIFTDPQGKGHLLRYQGSSRDDWLRTTEGWKVQRSEDLTEQVTVDGKPLNVPAAAPGR
jgi:hypothetical protein